MTRSLEVTEKEVKVSCDQFLLNLSRNNAYEIRRSLVRHFFGQQRAEKLEKNGPRRSYYREKIEDYLRFLTHAGETRFPIFAWESLGKLSHFVNRMRLMLTLTLEIV